MASVSIDFKCFDDTKDVRFRRMGKQLGIERDLALIKCARVWAYCIEHGTYRLRQDDIDLIVDIDHFGEVMLRCGLASDRDEKGQPIGGGLLEIKGTKGRIEYLTEARARQKAATEAAKLAAEQRRKAKSNLGSEVGSNIGTEEGSETFSESPADSSTETPSHSPSSSDSSSSPNTKILNPTELVKKSAELRVGDKSGAQLENSEEQRTGPDPLVAEVISGTIARGRHAAAVKMIRTLPLQMQTRYRKYLEEHGGPEGSQEGNA